MVGLVDTLLYLICTYLYTYIYVKREERRVGARSEHEGRGGGVLYFLEREKPLTIDTYILSRKIEAFDD